MNISFKKGILGFEGCKSFEVTEVKENPLFKVLKSNEEKDFSLVVISPFEVEKNYEFEISEEIIESLNVSSPSDIIVYSTVTINTDINKTTINLRAPIIVNTKNNLAEQVILKNENYKIKHPLLKR